jgi:hypothetical protein
MNNSWNPEKEAENDIDNQVFVSPFLQKYC